MTELVEQKCVPCRAGTPTLTEDEIEALQPQVPEWDVVEQEGEKRLERTFVFDDYRQALTFTHRVGEMAEEQDHHPVLVTEWGKVRVTWWTHTIGGLHRNDFIAAAKTDEIYAEIS
jgi:4a-hydroxytetrahydrobiopterin dehydratase